MIPPDSFSDPAMQRLAERVQHEHDLREAEVAGLREQVHGMDGTVRDLRQLIEDLRRARDVELDVMRGDAAREFAAVRSERIFAEKERLAAEQAKEQRAREDDEKHEARLDAIENKAWFITGGISLGTLV